MITLKCQVNIRTGKVDNHLKHVHSWVLKFSLNTAAGSIDRDNMARECELGLSVLSEPAGVLRAQTLGIYDQPYVLAYKTLEKPPVTPNSMYCSLEIWEINEIFSKDILSSKFSRKFRHRQDNLYLAQRHIGTDSSFQHHLRELAAQTLFSKTWKSTYFSENVLGCECGTKHQWGLSRSFYSYW